MSKIKFIQYIEHLLILVYICLLIFCLNTKAISIRFNFIFSIILALISMSLVAKGMLIKSGSTIWFSVTLAIYAVILIVFDLKSLEIQNYYLLLIVIPIISSIINLIFLRNAIYIKVIILNLSLIIPLILKYLMGIEPWMMIIIYLFSVTIGILICRMMSVRSEDE